MYQEKAQLYKEKTLVDVDILVQQEGEYFTAYCPVLEVSSYGNSVEEALKNFEEALDIFIEDAVEGERLEIELLNLGWTLRKSPAVSYVPPAFLHKDLIQNAANIKEVIRKSIYLPV